MSNDHSLNSVSQEKKVASYESQFREKNFDKPQDISLVITAAHLYGQAYTMRQEGTKEGDPIYERFICPLEEITKVYINGNVKASPVFIQCDTNVKGVIHRKRIIVPCLQNVKEIVKQINQVKDAYMEKYEAALEKEKQKKREELEAARLKEQMESSSKEAVSDEKPVPAPKAPAPVEEAEQTAPVTEAAAEPAPEPKKPARKKKDSSNRQINELKKLSLEIPESFGAANNDISNSTASDEFKNAAAAAAAAAAALENAFPKKTRKSRKTETAAAPAPDAAETEAAAATEAVDPAPAVEEDIPAINELPTLAPLPEIDIASIDESFGDKLEAVEDAPEEFAEEMEDLTYEEPAPEDYEVMPDHPADEIEELVNPVSDYTGEAASEEAEEAAEAEEEPAEAAKEYTEEAYEAEPEYDEEEAAETEEETAFVEPEPSPVPAAYEPRVNPNGVPMGLEEFQTAVLKIKSMKDSGLLSDEKFNEEKKKLLASLY